MQRNIAIFASGSGSNAQNIIEELEGKSTLHFPFILTNKADAYVLERARKLGVPGHYFPKSSFDEGEELVSFLREHNIDGIVLAGFLLKVSAPLLEAYPNKIINIHPALLPRYGGKGMYGHHVHEAVKNAGETESGITIHYVNEQYDAGDIIFQAKCPVLPHDNADDIAAKVHELEYAHFPHVIQEVFER
ncbi:MAG: phosphoribosylglycinamide formyltransferase [Paludibacteraceae bacterium]|nr:phosphoribosylglycinamide formyltransferase [Paludibacteraceae bacterium]